MNALQLIENRKKFNLSQEELSELAGIAPRTILNYENFHTNFIILHRCLKTKKRRNH